ncbi:hypothetical protein JXB27_02875 [Candidatus Woesearchaeota archaeon]|nr:hypothetical protein [Candidatus Woesearchaeota archaeon]
MKWLLSLTAFILLAVSISSITTNIFLEESFSTFEKAKQNALTSNDVIVDKTVSDFYSGMNPDQKANIDKLSSMTKEEKSASLPILCSQEETSGEIFCDSRFIRGEMLLDDVIKEKINEQVDNVTVVSMDVFKSGLEKYQKNNLVLIAIATGILSLMIYLFASGARGIQKFSGNACWLSLLSALSFKAMPFVMDGILKVTLAGKDATSQKVASLLMQTIKDWLIPAMDKAFFISLIIAVISFIVWAIVKLRTEYSVVQE